MTIAPTNASRPELLASRRHERGITLVEMMVAMVVGLILLVGIIQLFVSNKQAYRIQEGTNVMNENARYILNQMQYDLRMGDHWGGVESPDVEVMTDIDAIDGDCGGTAAAIDTAGVYGIDGDAASPLACIPDSDYVPNSDIVIVRYAEPTRRASGLLADDKIYIRSAIGRRGVVFQGANKADIPADMLPEDLDAETVAEEQPNVANYELRTIIYFLRPCASQDRGTADECDAADDNIPTLARLTLQGTKMVEQDVIAGVEQLQLAYGLDTDGDRAADIYKSATDVTGGNDWDKVVDIKLSVLIRNSELDVAAAPDAEPYHLYGGADGDGVEYIAPADVQQYRRKVYNASIQVRNMTRG